MQSVTFNPFCLQTSIIIRTFVVLTEQTWYEEIQSQGGAEDAGTGRMVYGTVQGRPQAIQTSDEARNGDGKGQGERGVEPVSA